MKPPKLFTGPLGRLAHKLDSTMPGPFRGRIWRTMGIKAGHFIAPEVGSRLALLTALQAKGSRYAVLAGHPAASILLAGSPLKLLVDDDHVAGTRPLFTPWPVGDIVETYSPTGLSGFAYGDMPMLPPTVARDVLNRAIRADGVSTAAPRDAFLFSIYWLTYVEGYESGLEGEGGPAVGEPTLAAAIGSAGQALGLAINDSPSLEELDQLLAENGWQPPLDMLERIGCWNSWVAAKLQREGNWMGAEEPGLVGFYLRQRALDLGNRERVLSAVQQAGFSLLPMLEQNATQLAEIAAEVRGGNWGRGPFPVSGGNPALVFFAHDASPIPPQADTLRQFPLLDNARIQAVKQAVRDLTQAKLPKGERYNPLHSTDNAVQAWRALRATWPEREPEFRTLMAKFKPR